MQILAVDDDKTFLQLLQSVLAAAGYDALETALSAPEAKKRIDEAESAFDCVLLDIDMPGIDGIELCRQIRAVAGYEITPILMLTAKLDDASIEGAFEAGATDYVTKPLRGLELGARIRTARLLTEQMRISVGLERSAAQLASRLGASARRPLEEAFVVEDVPACLSEKDLERVLSLLPANLFAIETFALRIEGIESLYEDADAVSYDALIRDVVQSVSRKLAPSQHFIAHAGDGVFGCVVVGRGRQDLNRNLYEPFFWNVETPALGDGPRVVQLSMTRVGRPKVESGKTCVDTLRTAIATASEDRLVLRLKALPDLSKPRPGHIVPKRPRLGARRRPRPVASQAS